MHVNGVLHIQGLLLLFGAVFMLAPLPFSVYYGGSDAPAILLSAGITAASGFLIYRFTRLAQELRVREGFAIVTFGWLFFSLFGSLPYLLSGAIPSFTDAFFETVSGFTTTGATILGDIEALPRGILFWRSLTQWMGGMGIIVFSLAVLPMIGVGGMQLYKAEVSGPTADKLRPRVAETARALWIVYVAVTAVLVVLLLLGGMDIFDAICHAFTTAASGGFSTRNLSLGYFNSTYIDLVVIVFMVIAGTNYALHYHFLTGRRHAYRSDREFHVYLASIAIASLVIAVNTLPLHDNLFVGIRKIVFTVTSMQTSTGYAVTDYEKWPQSAQFVLLLVMIIGGCAGSTAGGLKVIRLYMLAKYISVDFTRLLHPQAVVPVRMRGVAIPRDVMSNILSYSVLYGLAIFVATAIVTAFGMDWISGLSSVVSMLGTMGPAMNAVGPYDHYGALHAVTKWVLIVCMLLGRLEFYAVLVLFAPAYWRK
jgi:trk system potassium uptake protein